MQLPHSAPFELPKMFNIPVKRAVQYLGFLVASSALASCGGGGSGGDSTEGENALVGTFVDSPVEGLGYSTATQSGLTNAAGEFDYLPGEVVSFRIGTIDIGAAFGAEYLSPLDISSSFLPSSASASNIARILQTLDVDGDPSNGIVLPPAVAALPEDLDINDTAAVETALGQALVSATDAETHLNNTVSALPPRAVDGVYQRVTIGSTGNLGCPNVIDAQITVSRDALGNRVYDGSITLAGGGQHLFTANDSTIRSPSIPADPDHLYSVDLNTYEGRIAIRKVGASALSSDCGEIRLTTDAAVNLPPIVRSPSHITTAPGCTSAANTYSITAYFYGYDKDGFIPNNIQARFAVGDGELTTLVSPGDTTACANLPDDMGWDPAPPVRGGWYCSSLNDVMDNIPCTAGYNWEVSATDNEGLTTTITGGSDAPFGNGSGGGAQYTCSENYPTAACDILADTPNIGTVTSHPVGSCLSLVPQPRSVISYLDPNIPTGNLIINFDSTGMGEVSCLVVWTPE